MSHNQNEAGWRYQSDGYATLSINEGSQDEQHNNGGSNYDAPNDGHQDYGSNSDRFYNNKPHGESSHAFVPPVHSRRGRSALLSLSRYAVVPLSPISPRLETLDSPGPFPPPDSAALSRAGRLDRAAGTEVAPERRARPLQICR